MRITCPTCAAAYEVPAQRLAGGRTVRCARCGSGWTPSADDVPREPPLEQPPEPLPDPPPEPAALPGIKPAIPSGPEPPPAAPDAPALPLPVKKLGQPLPILLAWAASLAVLGALTWAVIAWRGDVMRAWPPSERLYAALGLLRR